MKGIILFFNQISGWGFAKGEDEKSYFVHAKELQDIKEQNYLIQGVEIEFTQAENTKGTFAKNIKIIFKGE